MRYYYKRTLYAPAVCLRLRKTNQNTLLKLFYMYLKKNVKFHAYFA